jgi:threonine aldolase
LAEDHARARRLAEAVAERWPASGCDPASTRTNIVVFPHADPAGLIAHLAAEGVLVGTIAPGVCRLVTHHDVDDAGVERAMSAIVGAP